MPDHRPSIDHPSGDPAPAQGPPRLVVVLAIVAAVVVAAGLHLVGVLPPG